MRMEEVKISENENFVHSIHFDRLHVNVQKLETFYAPMISLFPVSIHSKRRGSSF